MENLNRKTSKNENMNSKILLSFLVLVAIIALTEQAGGGKRTTHAKRRTQHPKRRTRHPKRRTRHPKRRTPHPKRRTHQAKTQATTTKATTTQAPTTVPTLPPATCSNVVTQWGDGASFNLETKLNYIINPGSYLSSELTKTVATANACCLTCQSDTYCIGFTNDCFTRQCQFYKAHGVTLGLSQQTIFNNVLQPQNGYVCGY